MEMKNNEQHAIDTAVRQALENLEIPYKADHWQSMAEKLGALDAAETEFDENLVSKLKNIEVPFNASNWADMSARLDDLDDSETAFDAFIGQRLEGMRTSYQPNHWHLMADKIEQTFSWRAKIVRYKVVEVALVLLTLFTVGNMIDLPFDSDYTGNGSSTGTKVEGTTKAKNGESKKTTPTKAKENKSFYNPTDWRNRPVSPNNTKPEQNTNGKPIVAVDNVNGEVSSNKVVAQTTMNRSGDGVVDNIGIKNVENQHSAIVKPISLDGFPTIIAENTEGAILNEIPLKKVNAIGKVSDDIVSSQEDALAMSEVLNPVNVLKPSLLNTSFYDEKIVFPKQAEKKTKWRLNIFGLPIVDKVESYYLVNRDMDTLKQVLPNLGAGIAAGYKKGRWEVETGLTYLDKKYDLPDVLVVSGNLRTGYSKEKALNVRLSIVSIPLSVNYTVKETRRLSLYARLGTALNTILKTKEDKYNEAITGQNSAFTPQKPNLDEYEPNVYPKGVLEKGFLKDGKWINGGLKENTYLTANAGIGVEYRLTKNTDIYIQPTFDYHFSKRGIGTLNDRIHSFSVQGGVKTKLK